MPTLEQRRAAFALKCIDAIQTKTDKERSKYRTQLLKLPARLHSNGLGQTVAFYLSAGPDKPEAVICKWIEDWLKNRIDLKEGGLLGCITAEDSSAEGKYRAASAEARAFAVWLKRFAEAFIKVKETSS
jgi:CRISPR-associated protein Cmr5